KGYTQYEATAKVLMAYGMLLVTDLFGDAPYSEAFLGFENLEPKYDRQEDIYASIQQLLDEAMIGLNAESAPVSPGADDLIFGGDMVQWRKFANALRARTFLHLGKVSASNYSAALAAIDAGAFTTAADDAVFHWGINETEAGPWYQFIQQRDHIIYVGYMFDLLEANHDPRYFAYLDTLNFNSLGSYYAKPDAVFFFHSFMEQKFIEAEAAFQTGDFSRAASACNDAVLASLSRHNISNPGFEATYASASASDITLKKIMVQKYIAMFLDVEAFTDWRRTGIPSLTPAIGNSTGNIIPRRLLYPTSERRYNSNNFQKIPITEPVWWDQ
ncbi:MAG TPA: SusD/RagB family nutrient-binding outer membrane lipoprotein, partial [Bacteroidetes bacterium]|nr:SusD/RagB family nutrient-binding outer membrane lipoprotein [Bacteroidota bacterium]